MFRASILVALAGGIMLFLSQISGASAETTVNAPAAQFKVTPVGNRETAVFAGGCFWGVEGVFRHVKGVISATSGYAGGTASSADYETVSTGQTGHAESVRVVFDPAKVNYADLLRIYFSVVADPTTLNRQGPDVGTQYRTALFPTSPAQEKVAKAYIAQLNTARVYPRPIVTRVEASGRFYPAETYHQDFMARNPTYPYIVRNDRPKVEALKRIFPGFYRG